MSDWTHKEEDQAHQIFERGSQTDNSTPLESSMSRKSESRVLPRKPPYMKTKGPTAATACRHRLQSPRHTLSTASDTRARQHDATDEATAGAGSVRHLRDQSGTADASSSSSSEDGAGREVVAQVPALVSRITLAAPSSTILPPPTAPPETCMRGPTNTAPCWYRAVGISPAPDAPHKSGIFL